MEEKQTAKFNLGTLIDSLQTDIPTEVKHADVFIRQLEARSKTLSSQSEMYYQLAEFAKSKDAPKKLIVYLLDKSRDMIEQAHALRAVLMTIRYLNMIDVPEEDVNEHCMYCLSLMSSGGALFRLVQIWDESCSNCAYAAFKDSHTNDCLCGVRYDLNSYSESEKLPCGYYKRISFEENENAGMYTCEMCSENPCDQNEEEKDACLHCLCDGARKIKIWEEDGKPHVEYDFESELNKYLNPPPPEEYKSK